MGSDSAPTQPEPIEAPVGHAGASAPALAVRNDQLVPLAAKLDFAHSGDRALGRRGLRPAQPRVSVVVPAKGEAANIREILPYLSFYYEVILVLNEGDEESTQVAREVLPSTKIVYQTRRGKGTPWRVDSRRSPATSS